MLDMITILFFIQSRGL